MTSPRFIIVTRFNAVSHRPIYRVWDTYRRAYVNGANYSNRHIANKRVDRLNVLAKKAAVEAYIKAKQGE